MKDTFTLVTTNARVDKMPAAIVLGLDFGTTQSCASAIRPDGRTNPGPDAVHTVTNYPDDPTTLHITGMSSEQVPTEIFYPDPAVADSYMDVDDKTASATFDFEQGRVIAARQRFSEQSDETAQRRRVDSVGLDEEPVTRSLPKCARWGFECQHSPVSSVSTSPRNDILRIFKLMLDQSEATVDIRRDLCVKLNALKRTLLQSDGSEMIIERHEDPISDFLSCQLQHTKHQLQHDLQLQDDESMELVFTVPAIWTPKACRVMERAILGAMTSANLGASSLISLFIVSEPEAAAAYMLANLPVIMRNTTFVLLDAGGGTIDATTYMVSGTDPLRLEREAVAPGGRSLLNLRCGRHLLTTC